MAVVESLGKIASIGTPDVGWWAPVRRSLLNYDGAWEDYKTLWRKQPNVRTVVSFLARNIAQLNLKVFRRLNDDERAHEREHPLGRLIRKPNPWTTRYRLIYDLVSDMAVYENAYWLKVRGDAGTTWVVPLPPDNIEIDKGTWYNVERYKLKGNVGEKLIDADEVVHFRLYNPEDRRQGISPLETLRRILAEDAAAGEYREHYWANAARMETVLKHPGTLSDPANKRLRADWEALYTGAHNSGKTAILEEGMDVAQLSFNARDSQYLEVRKLSREEVAAAYHIPPPMVGVLEHATFSNITQQHRMLYQDTLGPWLTMISEEIELQLLPEFGADDDVYVEFNLEEKLRGSFEEQAQALQASVGAPYLTRDEARALFNRKPLPNGEGQQIVTPLNVLVGGMASPQDADPTEAGQLRAASIVAAWLERQKRSVPSEIGGKGFERAYNKDRWVRELVDDLTKAQVSWPLENVLRLTGHVYDGLAAAAVNGQKYAAVFDALIAEIAKEG